MQVSDGCTPLVHIFWRNMAALSHSWFGPWRPPLLLFLGLHVICTSVLFYSVMFFVCMCMSN